MIKVGIGQDSHKIRLKTGKEKGFKKNLVLGGVEVNHEYYVLSNSDGDVILHSLCNSLSSAIGGDSLGTWADRMCLKKGIKDSKKFVETIMEKVKKKGYKVNNVAIAVEGDKPRLTLETKRKIKEQVAKLLETKADCVGLTFTSGEGLTFFGRGEGIQAFSVVSLKK